MTLHRVSLVVGTAELAAAVESALVPGNVSVRAAKSLAEAVASLDADPVEVVVCDPTFDGGNARELLARIEDACPGTPLVVTTSEEELPEAIEFLRAGGTDYLSRPFVPEQVRFVLEKALAAARRQPDRVSTGSDDVLGESKAMQRVWSVLRKAAAGEATVLVRGESGTGKELVARAIHAESRRAGQPFVKIDCAALPEPLLESELFGYEKGAFTGATAKKPGRVELAEGGTLFLDEIGELGVTVQAKLLRLLQDREVERLGGTRTRRVDVRVIAATHRDLEAMMERGQFRRDLFYRLDVVRVWLPPLRARRADIDLLARHFVRVLAAKNGRPGMVIDAPALELLRRQRWPGNVRQLQNLIERLVVLTDGTTIDEQAVRNELFHETKFTTEPTTFRSSAGSVGGVSPGESSVHALDADLREAERRALVRALARTSGNRTLAARLLGISRSHFYEKLAEHGLS